MTTDKRKYGKKQRHKRDRKCRFYNRGFCKFGRSCNFGHPQLVCKEYLEDGICRQRECPKRHPRHCRYWTSKAEGCKRREECQYLHVSSKRFSGENHEYENEDDTDACNQCDYESTNISDLKAHRRAQYTNGSDVCDISLENSGALRRHRRSQDDEMDERYSISRVGGRNGQWIFTCKTCEAHSSHRDAWKNMIRQSMRRVEPNNPIGFVFSYDDGILIKGYRSLLITMTAAALLVSPETSERCGDGDRRTSKTLSM